MTTNTSASGGFLVPSSASPLEDVSLEDALTSLVSGVTGIDPTLVRPRWQATPPKEPEITLDWCGVGVMNDNPDAGNVSTVHNPNDNGGLGSSTTTQQGVLDVMASFYGPNARGLSNLLRDGMMVAQNREAMYALGMGLVSKPGPGVKVPELINNQWRNRVDVTFAIRRTVSRTWPIENVLGVQITIRGDDGTSQAFTADGSSQTFPEQH